MSRPPAPAPLEALLLLAAALLLAGCGGGSPAGSAPEGSRALHDHGEVASAAPEHAATARAAERPAGRTAERSAGRTAWKPPSGPTRTLRVGPGGDHATIAGALAAAAPWDTVLVEGGVYRERLRVDRPVVLLGTGWPVVDGGGRGHVVEASAPLELAGFVIRGSGTRVDTEDAGVMVRGAPARVVGNRLRDVLFGIYLKDAPGSLIQGNEVRGKPLAPARRGDGIRLWHSSEARILGNAVEETRDVVVYFSDRLHVEGNVIRGGRYGLHTMYSHRNRFLHNRFEGNQVGAFVMYSREIELRENVFADAEGVGGMGLGLKDSDAVVAEDNLFTGNAIGIYLDNSPTSRDVTNRFARNVLLANGHGVHLLPSVRGNAFRANELVHNRRPVAVAGGAGPGQAAQNEWAGNHWSEYAGFDADGDGRGDTPFVHARLADHLLTRHPDLRLFSLSPSLRLVDALSRFFPLLRPEPVAVDPAPVLRASALTEWRASALPADAAPRSADPGAGLAWTVVALLAAAGVGLGLRAPRAAARVTRRRDRAGSGSPA